MRCPSETRLQAFVDGELSKAHIADLSEHFDGCATCRTLVAMVHPVPLDDACFADRIGRYVLRRVVGKGGMGVVYEAVDPDLRRVVALKVLRSHFGATQERLLAEARAMARLSHPNVVSVFDVGRDGERVFVVMALVQGPSLRQWLARGRRSIAAIVDTFEQAAQGLRAAHDAGLVHRDFKPENVFVAHDGRVLVGDFGLAVTFDAETMEAAGSLSYMAPEQRRGEKVDARSDQYSFCLALDEAVRSARSVPRWLSQLVARGTKADPAERFPSMGALLEAIRTGRSRSRIRRLALAGAIGVAGLATGALVSVRAHGTANLAQCSAREAEMTAIWNSDIAKKTEAAFRSTASPLADGTWPKTKAVLDAYAESWRGAQRRTCGAPRGSDTVLNAAFEQRAGCLTERLEMFRAIAASLEHVDAPTLEHVQAMLELLPPVHTCEDARELAWRAPPPSTDKIAVVAAAKKKNARAAAALAAGHYKEALALAEDAWRSAQATSYLPVLAEAYLSLGTAHGRLGHARESESALGQAVSSASAGHDSEVLVRAWLLLMRFVGYEERRFDEGARYAEYAKTSLASMPGAFELQAEHLMWSRVMLLEQERFDEAMAVLRQELAFVEFHFGTRHRLYGRALEGLAMGLNGHCKARDAIEAEEKACAILENDNPSHPRLANCLNNLAWMHVGLGELERARGILQRVLVLYQRVPGHPERVAVAHQNRVDALLEADRMAEATSELETAAALSHDKFDATNVVILRGRLHRLEGKTAEALADHALAVTRTQNDPPWDRFVPLVEITETNLAAGHYADAASSAEQAATIARSVHGESSCQVADTLRAQADALLGSHRAREALPLAERALTLLQNAQVDPLTIARAEFATARALPTTEHERARHLASSAREVAIRDRRDPLLATRITAWLARLR